MHRLGAERRDLARRVGSLERRQIHHPDREVEGRELRALLDRALRELAGAGLERNRVDGADARQPQVERKLEVTRKKLCLRHRRKSSPHGFSGRVARAASDRYRVAAMALGANGKIDLLKRVPLFEQCSKKDLQSIAQIADELDLRAGKVLIKEGERGREFFVIVERRGRGPAQGAQGRDARAGQLRRRDGAPLEDSRERRR